jgi:hypothetical protein
MELVTPPAEKCLYQVSREIDEMVQKLRRIVQTDRQTDRQTDSMWIGST